MSCRGEVLVAIVNQPSDLELAQHQHWYRIPIASVEKHLQKYWPPDWLAFYQTKAFATEAYTIRYYARVRQIDRVPRWQLFPDEPRTEKSQQEYYKLSLAALEVLPQPIASPRQHRITFIPTTFDRLMAAVEIADLYDRSS